LEISINEEWVLCAVDPRYEASNLGRIRNAATKHIRKPSNAGEGYHSIVVSLQKKYVAYYVHHLVARAFLGPIPIGQEVSHKNGDKTDNRSVNLVYETHKDNVGRKALHGTVCKGVKVHGAKLTPLLAASMRLERKNGEKVKDLAVKYGISQQQASRVCLGYDWKEGEASDSPPILAKS
jgi:hypothetical protein